MEPELVLRVDLESTTPIYRQIIDALRPLLVEGQLKPGDRLPTVRQLAVDLGVHHNTVAEAYRQLAAEGWLELGRRRGATVGRREGPRPTARVRHDFARRLRELVAMARADGLPQKDIAVLLRQLSNTRREAQS